MLPYDVPCIHVRINPKKGKQEQSQGPAIYTNPVARNPPPTVLEISQKSPWIKSHDSNISKHRMAKCTVFESLDGARNEQVEQTK